MRTHRLRLLKGVDDPRKVLSSENLQAERKTRSGHVQDGAAAFGAVRARGCVRAPCCAQSTTRPSQTQPRKTPGGPLRCRSRSGASQRGSKPPAHAHSAEKRRRGVRHMCREKLLPQRAVKAGEDSSHPRRQGALEVPEHDEPLGPPLQHADDRGVVQAAPVRDQHVRHRPAGVQGTPVGDGHPQPPVEPPPGDGGQEAAGRPARRGRGGGG